MGCGGSKNAVVPSTGSQAWGDKPRSATKGRGGGTTRPSSGKTTEVEALGSRQSLRSTGGGGNVRGVSSATSKASAHTCDSGLEADYYGNIITEESDPSLQQKAQLGSRPATPDLTLSGTQITSRKRSGKARTDQDIIHELKSQGLLSRPVAAQSGMSFEVMIAPEFGMLKKPPPRLAKLKKRKTKKRAMTREELEAKLKLAEDRRRRKEAEKLEKLNTVVKEKQVQETQEATEEAQKKTVAVRNASDMERVTENKEARLKAVREKQEKRKARAEQVRLARLARQAQGAPTQESATNEEGVVLPGV